MAAVIDTASKAPFAELVELRNLRSSDLAELLDEEIVSWRESLDWDFSASAELVRRFLDQRSLRGFALTANGRIFGYSYCVNDEHKGLIGDLYVRPGPARAEHEKRLLSAVLELLMATPYVRRIETQLMMMAPSAGPLPYSQILKAYDRNFMRIPLDRMPALRPRNPGDRLYFASWEDWRQESAAALIPEAYRGHIDSRINDQYETVSGARRFLFNIVQYPGCGTFFKPASSVALDRATDELEGLSLCSLVARDVGHVTQICIAQRLRGTGLGYELLRRSLVALHQGGCASATLTVTDANREAVRLYERMGFSMVRQFRALVWEGF